MSCLTWTLRRKETRSSKRLTSLRLVGTWTGRGVTSSLPKRSLGRCATSSTRSFLQAPRSESSPTSPTTSCLSSGLTRPALSSFAPCHQRPPNLPWAVPLERFRSDRPSLFNAPTMIMTLQVSFGLCLCQGTLAYQQRTRKSQQPLTPPVHQSLTPAAERSTEYGPEQGREGWNSSTLLFSDLGCRYCKQAAAT